MNNIAYTETYQETIQNSMKYFIPENMIDSKKIEIEGMPAKYTAFQKTYKTKPGCWDYTELEIINTETSDSIAVYRNYHSIDFAYVSQNGVDYIITSEDYQGFAILNLSTMEKILYVPETALEGCGWCPVEFSWHEDINELRVTGCIWACPYSIRTFSNFDFSNPNFVDFEEDYDEDDDE